MTLPEIQADNTARKVIVNEYDPIFHNKKNKRVPKFIDRTGSNKVPLGKECHGNKINKIRKNFCKE